METTVVPSSHARPPRHLLRQELAQTLPTDAEFEAFCIDFFLETQRLFAQGMDRQQKLNLLMLRASEEELEVALGAHRRTRQRTTGTRPRHSALLRRLWIGVLSIVLCGALCAAGVRLRQRINWHREAATNVLDSEPSGAEIRSMESGELLGHTPWPVELSQRSLRVCLQRSGFHDELLTLSSEQSIGVKVRMKRRATSSGADQEKEDCDVPIRIFK